RQRQERSAVLRPCRQDGQRGEVDVVASQHSVLYRSAPYALRWEGRDLTQLGEVRHQTEEPSAELDVDQRPQAVADVVEVVDAKCQRHATPGAEEVHDDGHAVPHYVLEQEGRAALFHGAVGDLGGFEVRRDGLRDASQLPDGLEVSDEATYVGEAHASRSTRQRRAVTGGLRPVALPGRASRRQDR